MLKMMKDNNVELYKSKLAIQYKKMMRRRRLILGKHSAHYYRENFVDCDSHTFYM